MALPNHIDAAIQVAVYIVFKGQPTIGPVGIAPIDEIYILTLGEQVAHHRSIFLQVDHPRCIDQRVTDQQRRLRTRLFRALEVPERELVFGVHGFARRRAELDRADMLQRFDTGFELASKGFDFRTRALGIERKRMAAHRSRPFFATTFAGAFAAPLPARNATTSARSASTSAASPCI